jgi:hypothetical protein
MVLLVSILLEKYGNKVSLEKGKADTVDIITRHPRQSMSNVFLEVIP